MSISAILDRRVIRAWTSTGGRARRRRSPHDQEQYMRYLSIYKSVETNQPPTQDEMERMGKLIEEGMKAGYLLGVEGCLPTSRGARVRLADGKVTVVDGPFTEAKEVVGGFAILQAASKAEAIEQVRKFLFVAGDGECELRELYDAPAAP
jgi:hypothetical protein